MAEEEEEEEEGRDLQTSGERGIREKTKRIPLPPFFLRRHDQRCRRLGSLLQPLPLSQDDLLSRLATPPPGFAPPDVKWITRGEGPIGCLPFHMCGWVSGSLAEK